MKQRHQPVHEHVGTYDIGDQPMVAGACAHAHSDQYLKYGFTHTCDENTLNLNWITFCNYFV